ncbi:MAG: TetR/AcrR family transcriptional regulator [Chloroflexi bacterium]|nr:TetR/AcrR family transcriptional regulator [Chloroflexota bacterium]
MAYRSSDKTRKKKDAKRTSMMQAAVRVFAEKGYHAATVRDIVRDADVAIGTFYFYFPDKETLFVHLYEETADFLLQAIRQGVSGRLKLPQQISAGLQAYINIAIYEPAVIQLLLVGGVGAIPSLTAKRKEFRERLVRIWQQPLEQALSKGLIPPQHTRRMAELFAGGFDEVVLNLLTAPEPEEEAGTAVQDMTTFALRAVAFSDL